MPKYTNNRAYGLDNSLAKMPSNPILAQRAPQTSDVGYPLGQRWIDIPNQAEYSLVAFSSGSAVWKTSPASGAGTFTSATINPGDVTVTAGDVTIALGDFAVTAGNATFGGDVTVAGTTTINGDFDLSTSALIDLVSTLDASPSILLHANGGTSEQVKLHSDQGTGLASVYLLSDVGGIKLYAPGLANAAAIALQADAGGLDVNTALGVNIDSAQASASAITLVTSDAAGGIALSSGTGGHAVNSNGDILLSTDADSATAIAIQTNGGTSEIITMYNSQGTDAASIALTSVAGGVAVTSGLDNSNAIYLHANAGTSEQINIRSDQGTGVASVQLLSDVGGITLHSGLASADAINLEAASGGLDVDAALQIAMDSSQASATAISVSASDAAGGMAFACGTGGMLFSATGGSFVVAASEDAAQNIYLHSNGGTSDTLELHADTGTGLDSIYINSDVGGILLEASGLADAAAIKFNSVAGGITANAALAIALASADDITLTSTNDAASCIYITENGGTSGSIALHSQQGTADTSILLQSDAGGIQFASPAAKGVSLTNGTQTAGIYVGTGSPNGSLTAGQGSLFLNVAGSSTSTRLYVNTDGGTTWTNFTSAA